MSTRTEMLYARSWFGDDSRVTTLEELLIKASAYGLKENEVATMKSTYTSTLSREIGLGVRELYAHEIAYSSTLMYIMRTGAGEKK